MNVTFNTLKKLCMELASEERILKSRLSPERIFSLHEKSLCYLRLKGKSIIGFAALWPTTHPDIFEFGTLWVRQDHRCMGLATSIFDRTMLLAPKSSLVFLITKSSKVVHEAKKRAWDEAKKWQKSKNWQKVCQPIGASRNEAERSFSADCRLFYTILD